MFRFLSLSALAACDTQRTLVKLDDDVAEGNGEVPAAAELAERVDTAEPSDSDAPAPPPADTAPPSDTGTPLAPSDTGVADTGTCGPTDWSLASFAFPADALSCNGPQLVRYDNAAGLWVGVVGCADGFLRLYLAPTSTGPFVQATDLAGHGQDHCELVVPGWTLTNEDDITSGGCTSCATSYNLPIEGVPTYARGFLGQPWTYYPTSGSWSWQTSRLFCGDVPAACGP